VITIDRNAHVMAVQDDRLVANDAGRAIDRRRTESMSLHVRSGTCYEERTGPMHRMQAAEIDIAAIRDVYGTRLCVSISRAWTSAILPSEICRKLGILPRKSNSMCIFPADFGCPEMCPRKDRQAQVDGCRVQCIDRVGQFHAKVLPGVGLPSLNDQSVGQFHIDPPIPRLIRIRRRRNVARAR
jgi:hypothetical protein